MPQFRPQAALSLLRTVLGRRCFTPLLPKNATLASMGDERTRLSAALPIDLPEQRGPHQIPRVLLGVGADEVMQHMTTCILMAGAAEARGDE